MRAKLKRILEENSARKNRISEQLREEPNSIERYITLLEYTRRPELFADIARTEKELATANLVCRTMEENYVEFEEDTYSWSLQSLAWVKGVQLLLRRA
jgi:transcriptional antiterminator